MLDQNPDDIKQGQMLFLKLITVHQPRIYGFIMSLVGDWNEADDIYQETTYILWNKFDEFTPGTDFLRWALKIARFQTLSHHKKNKTRKKYFTPSTIENLTDAAINRDENPHILDALRECVMKLSKRSRELLKVRYQDGESVSKMALRFNCNVNTLYKQFQKIHDQLFRCIRIRSERSL